MRYEMGPEGMVEVQARPVSTTGHVLLGLLLAGGAVAAAEMIAARQKPIVDDADLMSDYAEAQGPLNSPPKAAFAVIWPSMFTALTISGLRVWNSPSSPSRTRALTLWGLVQGFSATWMALGPRRVGGRVAAAVASVAAGAVYTYHAMKVAPSAGAVAAPTAGWMGVASLLRDQWERRTGGGAHTVH
ncbi:MAG: tryptophan-rich sensory protein [Caulobacter sp.]|nr:tryptophan-rich sensory protein [Caulobacter sp.]